MLLGRVSAAVRGTPFVPSVVGLVTVTVAEAGAPPDPGGYDPPAGNLIAFVVAE